MRRGRMPSCRAGLAVTESCWASQHETQHETPVAYSWGRQSQRWVEIGAVYNGSYNYNLNHSPARNKKTTAALVKSPVDVCYRYITDICQISNIGDTDFP